MSIKMLNWEFIVLITGDILLFIGIIFNYFLIILGGLIIFGILCYLIGHRTTTFVLLIIIVFIFFSLVFDSYEYPTNRKFLTINNRISYFNETCFKAEPARIKIDTSENKVYVSFYFEKLCNTPNESIIVIDFSGDMLHYEILLNDKKIGYKTIPMESGLKIHIDMNSLKDYSQNYLQIRFLSSDTFSNYYSLWSDITLNQIEFSFDSRTYKCDDCISVAGGDSKIIDETPIMTSLYRPPSLTKPTYIKFKEYKIAGETLLLRFRPKYTLIETLRDIVWIICFGVLSALVYDYFRRQK